MKTAFALGVLLTSLVPGLAREPQAADVVFPNTCENKIVHEPVLVYELAGSTLIAQIDKTLYVYADGSLKLAVAEADSLGFCLRAKTDPKVVFNLQQALVQAGVLVLCDDPRNVTDVPLNTLTYLRGTQDARAHTFSYWLGDGEYAQVDALLQNFIVEQFP
jgi:hypothetical protein